MNHDDFAQGEDADAAKHESPTKADLNAVQPGDLLASVKSRSWYGDRQWSCWLVERVTKTLVIATCGMRELRISKRNGRIQREKWARTWYTWGPVCEGDNFRAAQQERARALIHAFAARTNRPIPHDVVVRLLELEPELTALLEQIPAHGRQS